MFHQIQVHRVILYARNTRFYIESDISSVKSNEKEKENLKEINTVKAKVKHVHIRPAALRKLYTLQERNSCMYACYR
jgi:hypothetical protein